MKKVILVVVACFCIISCLQVSAFAAATSKIRGISSRAWDDAQEYAQANATINTSSLEWALDDLEACPGDELRIYLNASLFSDDNGNAVGDEEQGVTLAQLRTGSVTVFTKVKQGTDVLGDITLEYDRHADRRGLSVVEGTSYIKVEFAEDLASLDEVHFDCTIRLRVRGESYPETEITIAGVVKNEVLEVSSSTDSINLEEGMVVEALTFISNCRVEVGNGFSITTNLHPDTKYYGKAKVVDSYNSIDSQLTQEYPEIQMIYLVTTINMDTSGNKCRFDLYEDYYVYNQQGEYLGTSNDLLPYSYKYYLSSDLLVDFQYAVAEAME